MKNQLLNLLFFFVVIFSCKKETITQIKEVPIVHSWSLDSSLYGYNKILLASVPLNDSVLAVATNSTLWYINSNKLNGSVNGAFFNFYPVYGSLVPPSLTKTISVSLINSDRLNIFSTLEPVSNYGSITFSPVYSGSATSVKGFPLPTSLLNAGYPVISNKYILAPSEIDYTAGQVTCNLLNVDISNDPFPNSVSFVSSKNIVLTPESSTFGFSSGGYFSASYYNKFFISIGNEFYQIDTAGNIKAFGYNPIPGQSGIVSQMFTIDNYLFAWAGYSLFVSQDQGESWSLFSYTPGSFYASLTYLNTAGGLYAIYQSQIWKVTLSGSTLNYQELDNDGLETNQITSINKNGKYTFVTTLAGLYYRDTASFNTPKK